MNDFPFVHHRQQKQLALLYKKTKARKEKMVPEIKKILYATDLSANSGYVLRYALNIDAGLFYRVFPKRNLHTISRTFS